MSPEFEEPEVIDSSPEPCPFCGETDLLHCIKAEDIVANQKYIWCGTCNARGPLAPSANGAWDLWNERQ